MNHGNLYDSFAWQGACLEGLEWFYEQYDEEDAWDKVTHVGWLLWFLSVYEIWSEDKIKQFCIDIVLEKKLLTRVEDLVYIYLYKYKAYDALRDFAKNHVIHSFCRYLPVNAVVVADQLSNLLDLEYNRYYCDQIRNQVSFDDAIEGFERHEIFSS